MKLSTEYLILIDKKSAEALYLFCDKVSELNKLLQTEPDILIKDKSIHFKKNHVFQYSAKTSKIQGKDQRLFYITINFDGDESNINEYLQLLRIVRTIIKGSGGQSETLWDDVSLYYAQKAYPLIHNIENLMRKLITYFMLTNIGKEWVAQTSPNIVKEAIDKSKRKEYINVLHQIDFIHLGNFLFKSYQIKDTSSLLDLINKIQDLNEISLDDLKIFLSRSNWDKYFSTVVDCSNEYLSKKWNDLYEYRCMVAHNALFTKNDYEEIVKLINDVQIHLQKAIDNISKVHVPDEDKEELAEDVVSNISKDYGDFIQLWRSLEMILRGFEIETILPNGKKTSFSPIHTINILHKQEMIDEKTYMEGRNLITFRNRLVHNAGESPDQQEIQNHILRLEEFIRSFKKSWKDEILIALRALGGKSDLAQIYKHIENTTQRELPVNWKANVRYTLQANCPGTEAYKRSGGEPLFEHLAKGLWGLLDYSVE